MAALVNSLHGIIGKGLPPPFSRGNNYRTYKGRMVAVLKGDGIAGRVKEGERCPAGADEAATAKWAIEDKKA